MFTLMATAIAMTLAEPPPPPRQPDHHTVMAQQAEALAPFAWMQGTWRGEAVQRGPAGDIRLVQTERVGPLLGGSILVVEGRGYDAQSRKTEFNALGVLGYDVDTDAYTLSAHANGRAGTFPVTPVDGGFDWIIRQGPATIRYEARGGDGKWTETGYLVVPGREEMQVFRMELTRIGDADWPLGGTVPMED